MTCDFVLWNASELLSGKNDSSKTDTLSVRNQFANSWVIKRWVMPPLTVCGEGATSNDHSEMIVMPVIANIGSRKDQTIVEACGFGPNFPNWYAQLLKKKIAGLRSLISDPSPCFPGVKAVLHYTWNPDLKGSDNPVLSGFGPSAAACVWC